jgi:sugar/nucleoside kinase (ribokinase family)
MKEKKVIAIGNAIVDILCEVDDNFLTNNALIKGSMSLIDEPAANKLSKIEHVKITSGGSAGNTVATISQLESPSSFIGKIAMDEFGKKFINEIEKSGTHYASKNYANSASAKSFILVSKDAQRTMCTFLGCASEIYEEDIDEKEIKNHEILYLEGYLWDQESTINALKKAISIAKENDVKIAFTLSDLFCVARHKKDFLSLVKNDLDILFTNEQEIKELTGIKNIEENNFSKLQEFLSQNENLITIVTRGKDGFVTFVKDEIESGNSEEISKLIDTTGAGDAFAAGFLHGFTNNKNILESAKIGNICASKIIQKFGARFEDNEIEELKNAF